MARFARRRVLDYVSTMHILFTGLVFVSYSQLYLESRPPESQEYSMREAFAGQSNGLAGGAMPGFVFLVTGQHTGRINLTAELHDAQPALDASCQEVVEVSFNPQTDKVALIAWGGMGAWPLDLQPRDYRLRYCISGMDEAQGADLHGRAPVPERYLMQFWPGAPASDQVIRQTSGIADYWHRTARELPPPPTAEQRAEARRLRAEAAAAEERQREAESERARWGGKSPSDRLRSLGGNVLGLVELDRALLDAIAALDDTRQRQLARYAARRAYTLAGLAEVDWIQPALAAMDRGGPLPPPFEDPSAAFSRMLSDRRIARTLITSMDGTIDKVLQQAMAMPALTEAMHPDPLRAAVDAVFATAVTHGSGYRAWLADVWKWVKR